MKKILYVIIGLCCTTMLNAQSVIGAWEAITTSENGESMRNVVIFAQGYQVLSTYEAKSGKFVHTNGGTWEMKGDTMTETVEFHTDDPQKVGSSVSFKVKITENTFEIPESGLKFSRIDDGSPGKLQGPWLMSGRVREGKIQTRDTNRPRKTMKILSGTRFQWIAYNTETKQFMGTGGGTYTTENGKYTENIEFFSRDDTKAGMSLEFNYEIVDGNWHHSGFSSKGDPMHEIWSMRE